MLAIPVDLFVQAEAKPASPSEPAKPKDDSETADPALRAQRRDGGVRDAAGDSAIDAAAGIEDAASDSATSDANIPLIAEIKKKVTEVGIEAMLAPTGPARAEEPVKVVLIVNGDVVRAHPLGPSVGALLRRLPGWDDVLRGTGIDPLRDTDWVMLSGPSLVNSARDVLLLHYSAGDSVVDRAVGAVSSRYERGGPVDAGVPGVKATLARPDRNERMLLRPQSHLLAVVPPTVTGTIARQLVNARFPGNPAPETPCTCASSIRMKPSRRSPPQYRSCCCASSRERTTDWTCSWQGAPRAERRRRKPLTSLSQPSLITTIRSRPC